MLTETASETAPDAALGPLLSEHAARRTRRRAALGGLAILGLLGALAGLGVAYWRWAFAFSHFGPAVVWRWAAPWAWGAAAAGLLGLLALAGLLRTGSMRVCAHRAGLMVVRGRRRRVVHWSEVQAIRTRALRYSLPALLGRRRTELELALTDGSRLNFGGELSEFDKLVEHAKQYVYPRLLTECIRALQAGQTLRFGPLTIDPKGMRYRRRRLSWDELDEAIVKDGHLNILPQSQKTARPWRMPVHRIPNVEVCAQLIQHYGRRP